jgi:hypothetical protein
MTNKRECEERHTRMHGHPPSSAPNSRPTTNPDVSHIVRLHSVGKPGHDYIMWADYTGCCKPGEYDAELDGFVEICAPDSTYPTTRRPVLPPSPFKDIAEMSPALTPLSTPLRILT